MFYVLCLFLFEQKVWIHNTSLSPARYISVFDGTHTHIYTKTQARDRERLVVAIASKPQVLSLSLQENLFDSRKEEIKLDISYHNPKHDFWYTNDVFFRLLELKVSIAVLHKIVELFNVTLAILGWILNWITMIRPLNRN